MGLAIEEEKERKGWHGPRPLFLKKAELIGQLSIAKYILFKWLTKK